MALQVELVAADRQVWEGEATMVSARSIDGDMGVLPGHTPTLVALADGDVRVHRSAGGVATAHINGGFMSVDSDRVTIVSETVDPGQLAD